MSKKSYKVGYKKPPKEHQWPPGTSGNPSGTSGKKAPTPPLLTLIADHFEQPVEITSGGKVQKVSLSKALIMKLVHEAMAAPFKEKIAFLRELNRLGLPQLQELRYEEAEYDDDDLITEEDRRLLELITREIEDDDDGQGHS